MYWSSVSLYDDQRLQINYEKRWLLTLIAQAFVALARLISAISLLLFANLSVLWLISFLS